MAEPLKLLWRGPVKGGQMMLAQWDDMRSTLVCGESGSGKSWSVAHLCCQAVLMGMRPAIADPHGGEEQSIAARLAPLAPSYWRPAATTADDCVRLILAVGAELKRRQDRASEYFAKHQTAWSCAVDAEPRLLLVVDEVNELLRQYPKVAVVLKNVAQGGRKYEVYAILSGQHFTAEALGSTELRSAFASAICHRMSASMASMVTDLPKDLFRAAPGLGPGECFVKLAGNHPTRGRPARGFVPHMTQADVDDVARRLSGRPALLRMPAESVRSEVRVSERTRQALWAQRDRVLELVKQPETSFGDAAMIVLGESTKTQGRLRFEAMRVVEEILRTRLSELEQQRVAV